MASSRNSSTSSQRRHPGPDEPWPPPEQARERPLQDQNMNIDRGESSRPSGPVPPHEPNHTGHASWPSASWQTSPPSNGERGRRSHRGRLRISRFDDPSRPAQRDPQDMPQPRNVSSYGSSMRDPPPRYRSQASMPQMASQRMSMRSPPPGYRCREWQSSISSPPAPPGAQQQRPSPRHGQPRRRRRHRPSEMPQDLPPPQDFRHRPPLSPEYRSWRRCRQSSQMPGYEGPYQAASQDPRPRHGEASRYGDNTASPEHFPRRPEAQIPPAPSAPSGSRASPPMSHRERSPQPSLRAIHDSQGSRVNVSPLWQSVPNQPRLPNQIPRSNSRNSHAAPEGPPPPQGRTRVPPREPSPPRRSSSQNSDPLHQRRVPPPSPRHAYNSLPYRRPYRQHYRHHPSYPTPPQPRSPPRPPPRHSYPLGYPPLNWRSQRPPTLRPQFPRVNPLEEQTRLAPRPEFGTCPNGFYYYENVGAYHCGGGAHFLDRSGRSISERAFERGTIFGARRRGGWLFGGRTCYW